ncbi:MAG: cobalt ECF transporter T component CbiQ [Desulfuromonas sp.]|uniref:cobalt ECF transporter T component CbiQ n=1 Tax=Desulfuromonas sp. TaxID=892 RepID=UPI000CC3746A|nr:cobalt ECF transporter T component CbiQ [Desulfuromonas sp.]PLX82369.1 MAG: cobalt ECF transporter T component CbiQ [Desulfuromonas sp.]
MSQVASAYLDIRALEALAGMESTVHRLDPRAKLVTTLVFIVAVVSFGRYEISALLPFFLFPAALVGMGRLPLSVLSRKLLLAAPFVLLVGIFNPLIDRETLLVLGPLEVSGGWVSLASLALRFVLSVGAVLILIATTGMQGIALALGRLGAPRVLVVQLLFLYRYLFVLVEEGSRLVRARAQRSFGSRGLGIGVFAHLLRQWLLRTLDRAGRIHLAMLGRGFDGEVHLLRRLHFGRREALFTLGWSAAFLAFRLVNLPRLLGGLITEVMR